MGNLSNALISRFERFGNLEDIDNAIAIFQQALNTLSNIDFERPAYHLNGLGIALNTRFKRLGTLSDLEMA